MIVLIVVNSQWFGGGNKKKDAYVHESLLVLANAARMESVQFLGAVSAYGE
jgi:hypothetical protein